MRVLIISQCSKNALKETRRIVDQFAERCGDGVWLTNITENGLITLKRLLKASARRNTAVACHWLRGKNTEELLWIVGNIRKFNYYGKVPTKSTCKDVLKHDDENNWHTCEAIAVSVGIAGLFHDFGKANELFQSKLKGKSKKKYEPLRHEWISLLLFKAFVDDVSEDRVWLERLLNISKNDEKAVITRLEVLYNTKKHKNNLRIGMPPIAKFIGWLILSHHRIPVYHSNTDKVWKPNLNNIDLWLEQSRFSAYWNSYNCEEKWSEKELKDNVNFSKSLPFTSSTWRKAACRAASRALKNIRLLELNWFTDRFSMHMARLALMLADHCYSSGNSEAIYSDPSYKSYANTDKDKKLKQKLDEHNIGVAKNAFLISKTLPVIKNTLPVIARHKGFKKPVSDPNFKWQDNAYNIAVSLKCSSKKQGFFGVNLASTGCGKTFANARIMYGLHDENIGCRFSVALGLRVLTLQTGEALKEKLSLMDDDVAVLIGSAAFKQLHELAINNASENDISSNSDVGSETLDSLFDANDYITYEGCLDDGRISRWLKGNPKLHKLVSAPILVCTIDHLISASDGCRGGKQIAPLLRLLTSDLVIDEPDDFDVNDLPALCRFVNFAGMCGSRVLLSSATLSPDIVHALFEAYQEGRKCFNASCNSKGTKDIVCCAWFDEFNSTALECSNSKDYLNLHENFIEKRIDKLKKLPALRKGAIVSVEKKTEHSLSVKAFADAIQSSLYQLHSHHRQEHQILGKAISIGLVRMANINNLVAVSQELLSRDVHKDFCLHFCIYHSRFPMLIRSKIERLLDEILFRRDPSKIWNHPNILSAINNHEEKNHIFIVFATSVAEVGRDHDYDWAIVEPSSMRSIIQLAGRVQRHRRLEPKSPNVHILQYNLKGLMNCSQSFCRPGFESQDYELDSKDLTEILPQNQYEVINAIFRLRKPQNVSYRNNLVALEHAHIQAALFGNAQERPHASLWWQKNAHWCGELQRLTPFRKQFGKQQELFFFLQEDETLKICRRSENGSIIESDGDFERREFKSQDKNCFWINCDVEKEIISLSNTFEDDVSYISEKFTTVSLDMMKEGKAWYYDPNFGFYQ